jgi:CubicO group peptidase (beta-lactamase class C family)
MTKPITATALMMLVDEGKVALDDPVSKYVPQFAKIKLTSGETPRAVTVFDVITHTSGLHGDQKVEGSLAEHMDVLVERGLAFEPGTKWQYSPGLNVCGRIIEVVSDKPYHDFLQERIFDPLGMSDSTFFPTKEQLAKLAVLYQPGENEGTLAVGESWLTDFSKDRVANPSGGLISTAENMGRFYQMILSGGVWNGQRLVSEESVKQMTTIQTGDLVTGFTPGNGWGLGWCVVREPQGVTESLHAGTYGHGGAFGTQGWVDPATKTIYVLMIQRTKFGNSDGSELRKRFHDAVAE